jgi:hypothetical protein
MAKPIWMIQRELEAAQARAAYYSGARPVKETRDAQPRKKVVYKPLFYKVGTAYPPLLLDASVAAVAKFGAANLGLDETAAAIADAGRSPRNFKPSAMKLVVGDATPTIKRAFNGTGRRYIKYSGNTAGSAQSSFSAPISCGDATPTLAQLETKAAAIKTAQAAGIGVYGRLWLEIERYNQVLG